jgi:hypothetical protein
MGRSGLCALTISNSEARLIGCSTARSSPSGGRDPQGTPRDGAADQGTYRGDETGNPRAPGHSGCARHSPRINIGGSEATYKRLSRRAGSDVHTETRSTARPHSCRPSCFPDLFHGRKDERLVLGAPRSASMGNRLTAVDCLAPLEHLTGITTMMRSHLSAPSLSPLRRICSTISHAFRDNTEPFGPCPVLQEAA